MALQIFEDLQGIDDYPTIEVTIKILEKKYGNTGMGYCNPWGMTKSFEKFFTDILEDDEIILEYPINFEHKYTGGSKVVYIPITNTRTGKIASVSSSKINSVFWKNIRKFVLLKKG